MKNGILQYPANFFSFFFHYNFFFLNMKWTLKYIFFNDRSSKYCDVENAIGKLFDLKIRNPCTHLLDLNGYLHYLLVF